MLSGCYQLMWAHSHLMWFLATRYYQLMWSRKTDVIGSCDLYYRAATPTHCWQSSSRSHRPWRPIICVPKLFCSALISKWSASLGLWRLRHYLGISFGILFGGWYLPQKRTVSCCKRARIFRESWNGIHPISAGKNPGALVFATQHNRVKHWLIQTALSEIRGDSLSASGILCC